MAEGKSSWQFNRFRPRRRRLSRGFFSRDLTAGIVYSVIKLVGVIPFDVIMSGGGIQGSRG